MNLEEQYLETVARLKATAPSTSKEELISCLDLTLLDETAGTETLQALAAKANQYQVAAICVYPEHLQQLSGSVKRATVVNFPQGNQATELILSTIERLIAQNKVEEIDYVFPYHAYFKGQKTEALLQCRKVYKLCEQNKLCFKVILETGALPSLENIYELSKEVIHQGCHFLKTSTGKIAQGATPGAAFAMLKAIKESKRDCGLKLSGGIKKAGQAFDYANLASFINNRPIHKTWFRIGASSLLDELINQG